MKILTFLVLMLCAGTALAQPTTYYVWAPPGLIDDGDVLMYWNWGYTPAQFYVQCPEAEYLLDGGLQFKEVDDCEDTTGGTQRSLIGVDSYPYGMRWNEVQGNHFLFDLCYHDPSEADFFLITRCDSQ